MAVAINRLFALVAAAILSIGLHLPPAAAGKRIALIIGNSNYDHLGDLNNPKNDARAIGELLGAHDIQTQVRYDVTQAELLVALSDFENEARGADLAILFYAGHGVHLAGRDVLLPRDVAQKCGQLDTAEALKGTVLVDKVVEAMRGAANRVVILDACRSGSFPNCQQKRGDQGSGFRGLGRIEAKGTLIASSVAPGELADDGQPGSNSPYVTRLLLRLKERPQSYFHDVLIDINREMAAMGKGGQSGDLYFAGGVPPSACLAANDCGSSAGAPTPDEVARLRSEILELRRKASDAGPSGESVLAGQQAMLAPERVPGNHRPQQLLRDCPECPELVVLPAGSFVMGSASKAPNSYVNEIPQHEVRVPRPLAVGRFEVTFDEWEACMKAFSCKHRPNDAGWGTGRRPIIKLSWLDAKQYVSWLSFKTGRPYRLLTEAEWEYAARAGTTTDYSTGRSITAEQANFDDGSTKYGDDYGIDRQKTLEVGSFVPNSFGLFDMHGNVQEWVEDCYSSNYVNAPRDTSVVENEHCKTRVVRGGSWRDHPRDVRSSNRNFENAELRDEETGFRVCRPVND